MTLDRSDCRRVARLSLAALLSLAPEAARAAEAPAASRAAPAKGEEVDAEMLRDLEVLSNPNYARDREIARRLSFYERMRMLDRMMGNQPGPEGTTSPAVPAKREVR